MHASIKAIAHHFPSATLSNEQLAADFQDWSAAKIEEKTGIVNRYLAGPDETASDLGVQACLRLFESGAAAPGDIDFLLLCTQSPDHFLPTTACLMQERLGLGIGCGALDINLGCSGYIYGLGLAKGLVETGQAGKVLLVTAETYSKHIHPGDRSVRTLFGDAAAATLVEARPGPVPFLGPFVYGTDGRGGANLMVRTGALRQPRDARSGVAEADGSGNVRSLDNLFMDGPEIFAFTIRQVPGLVTAALAKAGLEMEQVDHFVFHQANQYMLESLRRKARIPKEKFVIEFADCGNTVSSTIPIVLERMLADGRVRPGQTSLLVGFGVGYSWGAAVVRW